MADGGVEIDIYGDDLGEEFTQPEEFGGEQGDLYDDVIAAPSAAGGNGADAPSGRDGDRNSVSGGRTPSDRGDGIETNGSYQGPGGLNHMARRHQLYVGNLTWWTTDQDITDAVANVGVSDFQEVKFFENRANGQSKGFCVVSLGSENSMRLVMERLPKKDLHGQNPMVTLPTKQALNNFEAQQKTRPTPPSQQNPRGPAPSLMGGPPQHPGGPMGQMGGPPRMMNPNGPPGGFRPMHPGMQNMGMQGPPVQGQMPPRMQGPPMHQGMPMQGQGPPRFQNQGQWNGPPRQNGPRPGMPPQQRPPLFQGPPGAGIPRGPWGGRPPMQPGFQPGPQGGPPPHMQGPRGPVPPQMGGPPGPHGPQNPAPHVNPAFFNQQQPHPGGPPGMPPQPPHPQAFPQQGAPPRGPWPPNAAPKPPFQEQPVAPQLSEVEFEEIMVRNRTVSSSAIARAVSDAAAGEYSSAIETLVTAISLIKQSKVAHDERCKILISSLQDTLHGIESKSYSRRDRSRSRDRSHRRTRRERSSSRYREREDDRGGSSRYREREDDRGGSSRYRDRSREPREGRDRTRSREREHYREESGSRRSRPRNKSPETPSDAAAEPTSKRSYYNEDRYRSSDRDRERDREHRSRH